MERARPELAECFVLPTVLAVGAVLAYRTGLDWLVSMAAAVTLILPAHMAWRRTRGLARSGAVKALTFVSSFAVLLVLLGAAAGGFSWPS